MLPLVSIASSQCEDGGHEQDGGQRSGEDAPALPLAAVAVVAHSALPATKTASTTRPMKMSVQPASVAPAAIKRPSCSVLSPVA